MADERTYIKVHDGIADHPKIGNLSDRSFRTLIETWCWCSRHLTDGRVPRATWLKLSTKKSRDELVAAKLVDDYGDVVVMHDYTVHQRSAAEVQERRETKRRAGAKGNHSRWHTGPNGTPDPNCDHCVVPPEDPNRAESASQVRSQSGSHPDRNGVAGASRKTSPEVEVQQEESKPLKPTSKTLAHAARDASDHEPSGADVPDPPQGPPEPSTLFGGAAPVDTVVSINRKADETFERFWTTYPRRNAKPKARKAWDKAIKRADPEQIIGAARCYTDSKPNLKYVPYPATWLTADSWNDDPKTAGGSRNSYIGYQNPTDQTDYHKGLMPS